MYDVSIVSDYHSFPKGQIIEDVDKVAMLFWSNWIRSLQGMEINTWINTMSAMRDLRNSSFIPRDPIGTAVLPSAIVMDYTGKTICTMPPTIYVGYSITFVTFLFQYRAETPSIEQPCHIRWGSTNAHKYKINTSIFYGYSPNSATISAKTLNAWVISRINSEDKDRPLVPWYLVYPERRRCARPAWAYKPSQVLEYY